MTGAPEDLDLRAVRNPAASPQQLADIASRRWDLHSVISAHPRVYPALREWIAAVNPTSQRPAPLPPYATPQAAQGYPAAAVAPMPPARRSGVGYWLAGCGCLVVLGVIVIAAVVLGALSSAKPTTNRPVPTSSPLIDTPMPTPSVDESGPLATLKAQFDAESTRFYELAATLDGNPAAPLVLDVAAFAQLEDEADTNVLDESWARSLLSRAQKMRQELEATVTAAETRRTNKSGSVSERMIDEAGNGFIDVRWDSASECDQSGRTDWVTLGCVKGGEATPTVHLVPENEFVNDWAMNMIVIHELGHIYQMADETAAGTGASLADAMLSKGYFERDREKLSDCYALTYYDEWSLTKGSAYVGYGYVCNETERKAIRSWAKALNAPMPG